MFWKVTGEIMVNLSQPMSFQTAAMAALDAVESRTASSQASPEENETDTGGRKGKSDASGSTQKKVERVKSSQLSDDDDDFNLDDDAGKLLSSFDLHMTLKYL